MDVSDISVIFMCFKYFVDVFVMVRLFVILNVPDLQFFANKVKERECMFEIR